MRRFSFYILTGLLTFGIGSFIGFNFYRENNNKIKPFPKDSVPDTTSVQNLTVKETKLYFPTLSQENDHSEKPFCRDKLILPVWNLITKDEYFLEQSGGLFRNPNCSDMFEVMYIDLNKDGSKEILLRGKSSDLCGATGNCNFWIFEKKGKNYRKILSDSDYVDITEMGKQITRRKTNGYFDVVLKGHMTARDTTYDFYKFDGKKYKQSKCLVDTLIEYKDDTPIYGFMSCKKFFKRWENEN